MTHVHRQPLAKNETSCECPESLIPSNLEASGVSFAAHPKNADKQITQGLFAGATIVHTFSLIANLSSLPIGEAIDLSSQNRHGENRAATRMLIVLCVEVEVALC